MESLVVLGLGVSMGVVVASVLFGAAVRPLLRNHAVAKALLILSAVSGATLGLSAFIPLLLHLFPALLLQSPLCRLSHEPLLLLIRLFCLSLAGLGLERLHFALKLKRELRQIHTSSPQSMYLPDAHIGCLERVRERLGGLLAKAVERLRALLHAVAEAFLGRSVLFAIILILAVAPSALWWLQHWEGERPLTSTDCLSQAGIEIEDIIGSGVAVGASIIALASTFAAHRISINFSRSHFHLTIGVRVKLRYTITLTKMVLSALLFLNFCQISDLFVGLTLAFFGDPEWISLGSARLTFLVLPPVLFHAVACLLRLRKESHVSPAPASGAWTTGLPEQRPNPTRTTQMRETTTAAAPSTAPRPTSAAEPSQAPAPKGRRGSSVPALPPIHRSVVPQRRVEPEEGSVAMSISQFYRALDSSEDPTSSARAASTASEAKLNNLLGLSL